MGEGYSRWMGEGWVGGWVKGDWMGEGWVGEWVHCK